MNITVRLTGNRRITVTLEKSLAGLVPQTFEWEGPLDDPVAKQIFALTDVLRLQGSEVAR